MFPLPSLLEIEFWFSGGLTSQQFSYCLRLWNEFTKNKLIIHIQILHLHSRAYSFWGFGGFICFSVFHKNTAQRLDECSLTQECL